MNLLNEIANGLSYFSVSLLLSGVLFLVYNKSYKESSLITMYLFVLLVIELVCLISGFYLALNTAILLSLSAFIHLIFLTYFYFSKVYLMSAKRRNTVFLLSIVFFTFPFIFNKSYHFFQPYDRVLYSLIITVYSLCYFLYVVKGEIKIYKPQFFLNSSVLFFFGIDTFLAVGTTYLVYKEYLVIVAWFWFFRSILLQVFYMALIYYVWKINKNS